MIDRNATEDFPQCVQHQTQGLAQSYTITVLFTEPVPVADPSSALPSPLPLDMLN